MSSVSRETRPVESAGPEAWSDYWDLYTWELSDPAEVAELGRLAVEAETDRRDVPPSFSQWLDSQGGIAWEEGSPDDPFARAEAEEEYYRTRYSS
jgi:hypothetical protein